jgi:hypothetical protein
MAQIGHMNFFQVNECGLYKVKDSSIHGLDITETFSLLQNWKSENRMADTIPWDPKTRSAKSKCYCRESYFDIETGDYLVVLWKSDTDNTGSLLGAQEDSRDGSKEVFKFSNENNGKKVIWGRPCYYWIIPSLNTVVSIRFEHSVCDSALFQEYLTACITNKVKHKNKVIDYTEHSYARISFTEGEDKYKYSYRFDMSLKTLDTGNASLIKFSHVTHIIRRETISTKSAKDERAFWLKLFDKAVPYTRSNNSSQRQIEIIAEANPTKGEIKEIISAYLKNKDENESTGRWDNVGFQTPEGRIWADKFRVKDQIVIPDTDYKVFPADFLYSKIKGNRSNFLAQIQSNNLETKSDSSFLR